MTNKNRSSHLFTSRTGFDRLILLLALTAFGFLSLCSLYAISLVPSNPAAWSMATFFIVGLMLLLLFEENTFPSIDKEIFPGFAVSCLFAWIFVAFLVSFLVTMDLTHLAGAVLFGSVIAISSFVTVKLTKKRAKKKKPEAKPRRIKGY